MQAQLEVEMTKNTSISDGTLPIDIGKRKAIVERTARKVIKRPEVIGNTEEPKSTMVIKRPRVIASIKDFKPIKLRSNDKR